MRTQVYKLKRMNETENLELGVESNDKKARIHTDENGVKNGVKKSILDLIAEICGKNY